MGCGILVAVTTIVIGGSWLCRNDVGGDPAPVVEDAFTADAGCAIGAVPFVPAEFSAVAATACGRLLAGAPERFSAAGAPVPLIAGVSAATTRFAGKAARRKQKNRTPGYNCRMTTLV